MAKEDFERDFGYLIPFLDRLQQAAGQLPAASRAELVQLLSGEKEKWARIRALLSGAAAPQPPPNPGTKKEAVELEAPTPLTVGSLKAR